MPSIINISSFKFDDSDKFNIIYLVSKEIYLTKMSRVRFHSIEALAKISNVIYWGPGWSDYDKTLSIDDNISIHDIRVDFIIYYKSAETQIGLSRYLKCIIYNEMYDYEKTLKEINETKPDLILCHHENDFNKYRNTLYKRLGCNATLIHLPHSAEKSIFYDMKLEKEIDILLCGQKARRYKYRERLRILINLLIELILLPVVINQFINKKEHQGTLKEFIFKIKGKIKIVIYGFCEEHYPLRQRYRDVLKILPKRFNVLEYPHPGKNRESASTNKFQQEFSLMINKSRICLTCTSKYKYRLGKMIEIPMCGSVLACDKPDENSSSFTNNMIEISGNMSNKEIANKLTYYLENENEIEKIREHGIKWSQNHTQEEYAKKLLKALSDLKKREIKVFIQSEDLNTIKVKWICDTLKEEFLEFSNMNLVNHPQEADVIWLLAPWCASKIEINILKKAFVITTIHHVDFTKYKSNLKFYKYIDSITNRYHTISLKSKEAIQKITSKEIILANFWINSEIFYKILDKEKLKKKYDLPTKSFVIGSFQKDTEGKSKLKPKLSKGPDLFLRIVKDLIKKEENVIVLLTGWRRDYLIKELNKNKINYVYKELVDVKTLNELYNCLDLYIVASRVEGGPRAILETSLCKTPVISTDVGISRSILSVESIFEMEDPLTYRNAKPNIDFAYDVASNYQIEIYMPHFIDKLFYENR